MKRISELDNIVKTRIMIYEFLEKNSKHAYTVIDLMRELYNVDKDKLKGSYNGWKKKETALYQKIRVNLIKMEENGEVKCYKNSVNYYHI